TKRRHAGETAWMARLEAARAAWRGAGSPEQAAAAAAAAASRELPDAANERMVNAQLVELAFLCLQFVALTDVFSGLAIPDEDFFPGVMDSILPRELIERLERLAADAGDGDAAFTPPEVVLPLDLIETGAFAVAPAPLKGARVPLVSYEREPEQATRDKGLTVGGVQTGVWGWSFGEYFPGGLVYLLMHHPELARFEPPYSLPLLFNEDEWRNGTQTGGFVSRRLKELAYLRIYVTTRARYGLEHHTMFLFNVYKDEYGVGRPPKPPMDKDAEKAARERALRHAENVVLYVQDPDQAPAGTFSALDEALLDWVERLVVRPHGAQAAEGRLRAELDAENRREARAGVRRLDLDPGIGEAAAYARLLDHQIAELAMLAGHMDGLGRAMTMLRLESEEKATVAGGYMTERPSLFEAYDYVGVTPKARTANELRLNPALLKRLQGEAAPAPVSGEEAAKTGEF
uniref:hypothetical protein n=1 Tax=Azospirillum tabaci TaxID=2752310 RepID=UPI001B3B6C23